MTQSDRPSGSGAPVEPPGAGPGQVSRRQLMKGAAGAAAGVTGASALASATATAAPTAQAAGTIRSVDVAVVGAGISGLYAAYLLKKLGRSFAVIEARDRTGGRILNSRIGVGNQVVEAGAEFIGAQDALLRRLVIKELKLPIYDTYGDKPGQGAPIVDFGKPTAVTEFIWPLVPPEIAVEAGIVAKTVPLHNPARAKNAYAWDNQTFASWLQQEDISPPVQTLFKLAGYGLFGATPGDASMLQFMYALHSHGGVYATGGITGGAQQNRVTGGSQRIPDALANRIGREHIVLNAPVRSIDQSGRRVVIQTDAGRVEAGAVILAIPPTFADAIDYQPKLPIRRAQLTQRFPMGYAVKVHAVYPKPFWRHETNRYPHTPDGLCGIVLSENGPITLCFDNSPGGTKATTGVLLGLIIADKGLAWGSKPAKVRRAETLGQFTRWFGPRAARPINYLEQDWGGEVWTRGYIGYPTTRSWIDYEGSFIPNLGRIFLAGTESAQSEGYGGMEGGLRAAARAVKRATG